MHGVSIIVRRIRNKRANKVRKIKRTHGQDLVVVSPVQGWSKTLKVSE